MQHIEYKKALSSSPHLITKAYPSNSAYLDLPANLRGGEALGVTLTHKKAMMSNF
jgi:hypothetical protein